MEIKYDPLIYGKDQTEEIVSLEVEDDGTVILFKKDGSIERRDSRFWILSSRNISKSVKLEGNLHYKYGKQFSTREEFLKARHYHKKDDIYSIFEAKEAYMVKDGVTYFKGLKPSDLKVLAFDIESTSLDLADPNAKVLLIANTYRINGVVRRKMFSYDEFENEGEMFEAWSKFVQEINPDVVTGHNIVAYDLPYMRQRASVYNKTLDLGRDKSSIKFDTYTSKFRKDQTQDIEYYRPRIFGREVVDTLFLAIKYDTATKKYDSYALKKIIDTEGITQEGRVFYDASKIKDNYLIPEEWEKIKKYAEFDGDDALALFDLMCPPYFYMTQSVPKSFQAMVESATGSQINSVMMRSYLQNRHSLPQASDAAEYQGAISFGNPGIYSNVHKIDVSSLYPSIILQYEVCDVQKDPQKNFLKIVQTFTERRIKHKKLAKTDKYYDDLQSAEKIFINSAYGFLGTKGLLFNSPAKAAFVTKTGREILEKTIDWAKDKGFTIVNADTDSISYSKASGKYFDEAEQYKLLSEVNSLFPDRIKFEHDGFFPKVIVLKAKNYILYDGEKIKTKGSAIKATLKEHRLREFIGEIIRQMVHSDTNIPDMLTINTNRIYNTFVREICSLSSIKGWTFKKSLTAKVFSSERTNETKVIDAISDSDNISQGDKVQLFFKSDGSLCLEENFDGDYDKDKLLEKLYKTAEIFESVLDTSQMLNYKLKRNKKTLEELLKT